MVRTFRFPCPKCGCHHTTVEMFGGCTTRINNCITLKCYNKLGSKPFKATTIERCRTCRDKVECMSRAPKFIKLPWIDAVDMYVLKFVTYAHVDIAFLKNGISLNKLLPAGILAGRRETESHMYFEDWIALCEWVESAREKLMRAGFKVTKRIRRKAVRWGDVDYTLTVE